MLINDGIPTWEDIQGVMPSPERLAKGPVAIAECFQKIPCNPCTKACVKKAIKVEPDINQTPKVDFDICNGCGLCLLQCPGLAIFIVDMTFSETHALVKLPFEFLPLPEVGQFACGLNRAGEEMGYFEVHRVVKGKGKNLTSKIELLIPKDLAMEVRNIKAGGYRNNG